MNHRASNPPAPPSILAYNEKDTANHISVPLAAMTSTADLYMNTGPVIKAGVGKIGVGRWGGGGIPVKTWTKPFRKSTSQFGLGLYQTDGYFQPHVTTTDFSRLGMIFDLSRFKS